MRRYSVTSGLLILVLATSTFGCVTAEGSEPCTSRVDAHQAGVNLERPHCSTRSCIRRAAAKAVPRRGACRPGLKPPSSRCSLRSLAQFQFEELRRFEIPNPQRQGNGEVAMPFNSRIVVLSIGSPETDRGPPPRS